ncbi:MAG: hypothetical protein IJD82_04730 [Clostridia bacterium]|nr:hypothetical protein [Clostridia bacterium]
MKKCFAILLSLALLVQLGVSVLAEGTGTIGQNGDAEIDVTAKYESSTVTPAVYSVDIQWTGMTFTYSQEDTRVWNAANHTYETVSEGAWDKTTATVTVTNHSNVEVEVNVAYTPIENTGVVGTLTDASAVLNAGVEGDYEGASSATATLTISGTPQNSVTAEGIKVGTLKVTLGE